VSPPQNSRPDKKKGRPKGRFWYGNLRRIKAAVQASNAPFLDRRDIETLFALRPRRAQQLLHELHAERLGGALVVPRETVLQYLHLTQRRLPYLTEVVRRRSIAQALQEAKLEVKAHAVRFKLPPTPEGQAIAGLPDTIRLGAGELRITCRDAQDLLQQLYLLSRLIAKDYAAFETIVRPGP
jgi:hypothetical protein